MIGWLVSLPTLFDFCFSSAGFLLSAGHNKINEGYTHYHRIYNRNMKVKLFVVGNEVYIISGGLVELQRRRNKTFCLFLFHTLSSLWFSHH